MAAVLARLPPSTSGELQESQTMRLSDLLAQQMKAERLLQRDLTDRLKEEQREADRQIEEQKQLVRRPIVCVYDYVITIEADEIGVMERLNFFLSLDQAG